MTDKQIIDSCDKARHLGMKHAIQRFNLMCEIEMNAHEPYKHTQRLSLEQLHKVRDMMLEQIGVEE